MIGTQVAHYRIVDKIGEGGMGVVYRARDLKLERDVALKFLPPHALGHGAEHQRLLQEARAASALAHPNVCVIHAIEEHDGQPFIVMELVNGTTLRHRIADGSIPVGTAVDWAVQILEALAEAHAHGIVHRDIKSENVMITARGQAKVMDFGLARLRGASSGTRTTSTVGTLGYMAPEQIRDGVADARSDLFSFGVLLYELFTGRLPFHGEREAGLIYAILNEDPQPAQALRPELGSAHAHVLDRLLEKDPEDRYQNARDALIDLRRIQRDSSRVSRRSVADAGPRTVIGEHLPTEAYPAATGAVTAPLSATAPPATAPVPALGWVPPVALLISFVALAITLAIVFLAGRRGPRLNPDMTFRTLATPVSHIHYPGMSPDGRWIAFPGEGDDGIRRIYFMNTRGGEVREIFSQRGLEPYFVDVSPNGDQIAFVAYNTRMEASEIHVVPSLGGTARKLADGLSGRWTPDGERVAFVRRDSVLSLWSVPATGGEPRLEFRDTLGGIGRYSFAYSPDGGSVAWLRTPRGMVHQELIVRHLASGRERQLTRDGANIDEVYWTRQRTILYSSNRSGATNLWMVPERGGAAVQVTKGTGPDISMRVSDDGRTLLYLQQQPVHRLWITSATGPGASPVTQDDLEIECAALSPDGRTVAASIQDVDPLRRASRLVLMDRNGGNRREVLSRPWEIGRVRWSPDGRQIAFNASTAMHPDSQSVFVVDPAPGGTPRALMSSAGMWMWRDSLSLLVDHRWQSYSLRISDGSLTRLSTRDSVYVFDRPGLGYRLEWDVRPASRGAWVFVPRARGDSAGERRPFDVDEVVEVSPDLSFAVMRDPTSGVVVTEFPEVRKRQVPGAFEGLHGTGELWLRQDGREAVVRESRNLSKLILVEDFQ